MVPAADLDLAAVRAFVAVTDERYFSEAAAALGISQQAVSKRVAKLEVDLGVRLFSRTRVGAELTQDGRAFLNHARSLVGLADQAFAMLRNRHRSLRVDVLDTRLGAIDVIRAFHRATADAEIDIITSNGLRSARAALANGSVDAAFARASGPLGDDLVSTRAYLEQVHLLVGRGHPLAGLPQVETERLAGMTVWMPGNAAGSEWADFWDLFGAEFGVHIDASGPDFGWEYYVEEIGSGERTGLVGEWCRLPSHVHAVQIPVVDPAPMYPCSLLRQRQNHHPVLTLLARFVKERFRPLDPGRQWLPIADRAAFVGTDA
ncbi:LysR family transcriptional regulator [Nonomuraea sp. WAC 01424]|uniref:LysR family transcriptional regulator n=1 Tax=Nonomuraea sp. WAC 01424 TaxID=2203200 RepID=UPI000F77E360|nr:LysR family transcriptional regulator [Nonomuraea sp. WAC 01424]RSN02945.1 LysR family transcriptional regulator [Nonomuraea sp. WAC 01424]